MSIESTLEGIWEDFKDARKSKELERMELCHQELLLEMNTSVMPNGRIQKHAARRAVMERSLETVRRREQIKEFVDYEGSW